MYSPVLPIKSIFTMVAKKIFHNEKHKSGRLQCVDKVVTEKSQKIQAKCQLILIRHSKLITNWAKFLSQ